MPKRVFIIHRWDGTPTSDWYPWLKKELESKGWEVEVPKMPETSAPSIEKWVGMLKKRVKTVDEDTFFVGHSIGCQAIMRYLQQGTEGKIGGAVFIAGWFDLANLEDEEVEEIARPWIKTSIDIAGVRKRIGKLSVVLSDNDPYDRLPFNRKRFKELGAKVIIAEQAGHFTGDDGATSLPVALKELERIAGKKFKLK